MFFEWIGQYIDLYNDYGKQRCPSMRSVELITLVSTMKAREMCKSVTRKIVISSPCNFTLHGMTYIAHNHLARLFKNHDDLALYSAFDSNVKFDDVFVFVRMNGFVE